MRILSTLITLAVSGAGLYYMADKNPALKAKAEEILDFRTTTAFELRYGPEQVMEKEHKTLLREKGARFLDPELKFYPYLVLEVKYSEGRKTKEGVILWDLTDGEMILDTKSWDKTHGFADCILTGAQKHELRILNLLAQKGGSADERTLLDTLDLELPTLEMMLRGCLKKNLILSSGPGRYRLHLESPKLTATPETKLNVALTSKSYKRASKAPRLFAPSQIKRLAAVAFGADFSIRQATEVYLPVHRIVVQHPNGTVDSTYYNALTGKSLPTTL